MGKHVAGAIDGIFKEGYWYGDYDKRKYDSYRFWHDGIGNKLTFGLMSDYIDNDIAKAKNKAYMQRYGMSYEDIIDPSHLYSSADPSARAYDFVSSNIKRLYK